ncbi:MAG: bifunctional 4-hydroxy-2-oxoglutarate aldolase/2-dehydro-3-deoxy-phosphogluconate aldolase [Clostridiales bacterium]|nr:bifunctional 4-hydroxy-2-oxoglutarate aldolase/2-dehydro-3-deoxy-phosphogluconate aldolase [Clostridiales bacterium]
MYKLLHDIGIIPVIKINDPGKAVPLASALLKGGLPVAEVTFRTEAAEESIKAITSGCPEMLTGAGTVLTPEQAERAVDAGARFIVSPGLNPRVVEWCLKRGVTIIPGCATPTELETALEYGINVVKFFPASEAGGLPMIKAMSAPYGRVRFIPTGGINLENLPQYLASPKVLACGGSFMVQEELINKGQFDEITFITRKAVDAMLCLRIGHVGINCQSPEEAKKAGAMLKILSGRDIERESEGGFFVGSEYEVGNKPGRGLHGHIAVLTSNTERAVYHLSRQGVEFDQSSAGYNTDGSLRLIYLKDEIAGFAFHLVER